MSGRAGLGRGILDSRISRWIARLEVSRNGMDRKNLLFRALVLNARITTKALVRKMLSVGDQVSGSLTIQFP